MSKPDCLYGPQVIDVIMRKPEFSFLIRYYNLLYQSLIPNCNLTIKTLKQHLEIPSDVESFIVNGESSRIRCQRIINLLLVQLDTTRDYKNFCYLFNMISVMTDLPDKLRTGITYEGNYTVLNDDQLENYATDSVIIRCVDDGPSNDRADNYSISSHRQVIGRRRCRPVTTVTSTNTWQPMDTKIALYMSRPDLDLECLVNCSGWEILNELFSLLCNFLSDEYQSTLVKLKRLPQLSDDDHQQLGTMISPSCEAQLVNERIVTFLIVKFCYNGSSDSLVGLCDVMDNLIESDQPTDPVQQAISAAPKDLSLQLPPSSSDTLPHQQPSDCLVIESPSLPTKPQDLITSSSFAVSQSQNCEVTTTCTATLQLNFPSSTAQSSSGNLPRSACRNQPADSSSQVSVLDTRHSTNMPTISTNTDDQYMITNPASSSTTGTTSNHVVTSAAVSESNDSYIDINPPQKIIANKDFAQLKAQYHTIVKLMPDNYQQTADKLINHISDDQICMILSSSNSTTANKIILDCLIERMSCREELLDLCAHLETISTSHQLMMVIDEIRSGVNQNIQSPPITAATNGDLLSMLLSSDQQHHSTSSSVDSIAYHLAFSQLSLDSKSKAVDVLKKNFVKLSQCLPCNYLKTVEKLKQMGIPEFTLQLLRAPPSKEEANEIIIYVLVTLIRTESDILPFCENIKALVDGEKSSQYIDSLMQEFQQCVPVLRSGRLHNSSQSSSHQRNFISSSGANNSGYQQLFSSISLDRNSKVLALLKKNYKRLCECLPQNHLETIEKLKSQIGVPEGSLLHLKAIPSADVANESILMSTVFSIVKEDRDIFNFLDAMSILTTSRNSKQFLETLRHEFLQALFPSASTDSTQHNNGITSSSESDHPTALHQRSNDSSMRIGLTPMVHTLQSEQGHFYQHTFSTIALDQSSRVLAVLKRNYRRLFECLPEDYSSTINKMREIWEMPDDFLILLARLPSAIVANERIISQLLYVIMKRDVDALQFCDIMKTLVGYSAQALQFLDNLKQEFLDCFNTPPKAATTMTAVNPSLPNNGTNASSGSHHPTTLHQTSNDSSVTRVNLSKSDLQNQLRSHLGHLNQGIKCPPPPPLPLNYVCRKSLVDEMASKLCQSTIDSNGYGTSLTVTGAGGFGKTSIVIALCHHAAIKEQFADGVVFIELGPHATDPSMKLSQLYHLLTGEYLKQGDINHAEQEIGLLASLYCRNLLVVIDDVWHVEDAEPIVKAFSNCKIVLTTRMNDIEEYIPAKQVVSVGPMEQSEAISLLTCGVIDISQLSQEDASLLDELAQDVHLWPLLLSLIRGQLSHNVKRYCLHCHEAIQNVQTKLHDNGLTAFDKNNIDRSRKYAVKVCIEVSLNLLTKQLTDKLKSLILWTGIGTSLQTAALQDLWAITEHEAKDIVDKLWEYGLVQFSAFKMSPRNDIQSCIEVHAVISQFLIESMNEVEVINLSPVGKLGTAQLIVAGMIRSFWHSYGLQDGVLLPVADFLEYKKAVKEFYFLPTLIKIINMQTVLDPHDIILTLKPIQNVASTVPQIVMFLPSADKQIKSLVDECNNVIKDAHRLSRRLNQDVQKCLTQRNYLTLIKTVEGYSKSYPISAVAKKAAAILNTIQQYCEGHLLHLVTTAYESIQMKTTDYHHFTLLILPNIKLHAKELMQIDSSLLAGSPDVELTYHNLISSQEEEELRKTRLAKLREVAPNYARENDAAISRASQTFLNTLFPPT